MAKQIIFRVTFFLIPFCLKRKQGGDIKPRSVLYSQKNFSLIKEGNDIKDVNTVITGLMSFRI